MTTAEVKDKIQKLLALSTSSNENEARDALLLAKKLMMKYKISEMDIEEQAKPVIETLECDVQWTTDSGNIWATTLAKLICDNYCCACAWSHQAGTRTYSLRITGLGADAQICKAATEYAFGFVMGNIKRLQKIKKNTDPKSVSKSYAEGFICGLEIAFEMQKVQEEQEDRNWALVIQKPEEVQEYENSLSSRNVRTKQASIDMGTYLAGRRDGADFSINKVLAN